MSAAGGQKGLEAEGFAYLQTHNVPQILDDVVIRLLKEKPETKEGVLRCLAAHSLDSVAPSTSAAVASKYLPAYVRSIRDADQLAEFSSLAHNIEFGSREFHRAIKSSPKSPQPQGDREGAEGYVEDADLQSPMLRSKSIAAYNKAALLSAHPLHDRRVKVIATIGPQCSDSTCMGELISAGMHVARFNLSHGKLRDHHEAIEALRSQAKAAGRHVAIAIDSRGAEVRLGSVPNDSLALKRGSYITLSPDEQYRITPTEDTVFITWADVTAKVTAGQRICVADGALQLSVEEVTSKGLLCRVDNDFDLRPNKNVNLPGVEVDIPILNDADMDDFAFAVENGISIVFLSFVQRAKDVEDVRRWFAARGTEITIIAKIENQAGLANVDEILMAADGLMVARGDLGSELPISKLFAVQKSILSRSNLAGKPVIVSAQLLESMCEARVPTRAEANDVANAVLDGADALMLSAETAIGRFPVEALTTLGEIAFEADRYQAKRHLFRAMVALQPRPFITEESIASSAVNSAMELGAKAIITLTTAGSAARLISKYAPPCPIIAVCKKAITFDMLHLVRSVVPFRYDGVEKDDRVTRLDRAIEYAQAEGIAKVGSLVILVHAELHGPVTNHANICRVWKVEAPAPAKSVSA